MTAGLAISARGLSKQYRLGARQVSRSLRETLTSAVKAPLARLAGRGPSRGPETFWALDDVSFDVKRGEVVGIIGRNGAGKSTLLKVLSRITEPTRGYAEISGQLSALLEVGSGFHPELTGRENIFLNGAILGMRRSEINAKFDAIVDFAEVEKFVDTPVKHYSSGMYLRLAFAVAAHLEPEVLVVDEVLAVGDALFQKKCIGRMNDLSKREGRTVLFVSHNMSAVRSLCDRALLLDQGTVIFDGRAEDALARYGKMGISKLDQKYRRTYQDVVRLWDISIVDMSCQVVSQSDIQQPVGCLIEYEILGGEQKADLWLSLYTSDGAIAFGSSIAPERADYAPGHKRLVCWFPANLLNAGFYSARVTCMDLRTHATFFDVPDAAVFEMTEQMEQRPNAYRGQWHGVVRPNLEWAFLDRE